MGSAMQIAANGSQTDCPQIKQIALWIRYLAESQANQIDTPMMSFTCGR
jgi:hypothetical protein